jgi:hypothetical protein
VKATRLAILALAVEGFVERSFGHGLPVRHGEAEIGEDFLHGDGLVVFAPLVGLGDGLTILFGERLIVNGSERQFH